jgi:uncharacterized membrane protein
MKLVYLPLALTVGGNLLYHVSQKFIPPAANPLVTMILAYTVAIVVCSVCAIFYPAEKSFLISARESNWAVLALGIGVATVEIGFLLAYRVGWEISVAPVLSGVAVALLLIIVGVAAFSEHLSVTKVAGIVFCATGLVLLTWQ